jgi:DUF971 family protein
VQPSDYALTDNRTALAVTWPDGEETCLDAVTLRHASRAASEIRRQLDGVELSLEPGLQVHAIEPIGNYALRLVFSDGHDRGIYPFAYLRELASQRVA